MRHLSLPDRSSGIERWLFLAFACQYSTTGLINTVSSCSEYGKQAPYRTDDIGNDLNIDDNHIERGEISRWETVMTSGGNEIDWAKQDHGFREMDSTEVE